MIPARRVPPKTNASTPRKCAAADESETQDYVHQESRQIIRDTHPGNWIKQRGTAERIPVDISIEQF